jgi:uncharacterized membrane protein
VVRLGAWPISRIFNWTRFPRNVVNATELTMDKQALNENAESWIKHFMDARATFVCLRIIAHYHPQHVVEASAIAVLS